MEIMVQTEAVRKGVALILGTGILRVAGEWRTLHNEELRS
jgi:hypothetical protein